MSYEVNNTNKESEKIMLEEYRERTIFSLLPLTVVDDIFLWTGKWFKNVKIYEQKYKVRYSKFDDGWTYLNYWSKWKYRWEFIKIIK